MNVAMHLLPYGKYLLTSGEVIWGKTPLYTLSVPNAYYDPATTEFNITNTQWNTTYGVVPVAASQCSVTYNPTTMVTELRGQRLYSKTPNAYTSACGVFIAAAKQLYLGVTIRPVLFLLLGATPGDPYASATQYFISTPNDVFASF